MSGYEKLFSINLKKLRKAQGITQKQLAEMTGYSEKAISKWECAASVPSIESLFLIARHLNTTVEALFYDHSEIYFLGIDGGGTKTSLLLTDSKREVIRKHYTDGCNPMDIGFEKTMEILRTAIRSVCDGIPMSSVVMFAGIAGAASEAVIKRLNGFFQTFGFRAFGCDTDNHSIIEAGLGDSDGIALILGTGICAFSKRGGELTRISGWGYLIDAGGSGYNFGQEALNAYFCAEDGSGPHTPLTKMIKAAYPDSGVLLDNVYAGGKRFIASFAPLVFAAINEGDRVALEILNRNVLCIARIIETAADKLSKDLHPIPVVIKGGLSEQEIIIKTLKESLQNSERYQLHILESEPVLGAVMIAQKLYNARSDGKC